MQALALQTPLQYAPERLSTSSAEMSASQEIEMQRFGTRCWRTLINQGVPSQDARELAIVVIYFIYRNTLPSDAQKSLIERYYRQLQAADLLSLQLS